VKKTPGISDSNSSRNAAFARKGSGVLKNRAFLNHQSCNSRKQWGEMRMKDADNKNTTCRNRHHVFGLSNYVGLSSGMSWSGA
jgi:hypothetical protein